MTPFNSQRYVVLLNHAPNLISQQTFNQVGKAKKNKSSDYHHLHLKTVPPLWYSLYNNVHVVAPLLYNYIIQYIMPDLVFDQPVTMPLRIEATRVFTGLRLKTKQEEYLQQ